MYAGANTLDITVAMGLLKWKRLKLPGRAEPTSVFLLLSWAQNCDWMSRQCSHLSSTVRGSCFGPQKAPVLPRGHPAMKLDLI